MKKTLQHNQQGNIHPVLSLVKPEDRFKVKLDQVILILKLRKQGQTFRQIAKELLKRGTDITPQTIQKQFHKYKEAMQYV